MDNQAKLKRYNPKTVNASQQSPEITPAQKRIQAGVNPITQNNKKESL